MCLKEKGKLYRNKPIMSYYYQQKVQSQFWPFFADMPSKVKYKMYDLFMCWLRKSQKELSITPQDNHNGFPLVLHSQ